jgi:hypothetical protein
MEASGLNLYIAVVKIRDALLDVWRSYPRADQARTSCMVHSHGQRHAFKNAIQLVCQLLIQSMALA